ncbi:nucleoside recognition domain-containing protein [Thermovenabulum sp.]|uniref:nucleoside recognition domain-containing protein n=1 Tax=Thermovenabulum sp. TaxID=3100335 RepID=UPI003C7B1CEA
MAMNFIFFFFVFTGIVLSAITGKTDAVTQAVFESSKYTVELCFGLIGSISFWMGLMKIAEESGLIEKIASFFKPVMKKLFPDIPSNHPAMGAMAMNFAANLLGLGNAATPLGLKAMKELQNLNPKKDTASNAMCTFLVINTSSITLIPTTTLALMKASGSDNPSAIIGTTLMATLCSTIAGIIAVKILEKFY